MGCKHKTFRICSRCADTSSSGTPSPPRQSRDTSSRHDKRQAAAQAQSETGLHGESSAQAGSHSLQSIGSNAGQSRHGHQRGGNAPQSSRSSSQRGSTASASSNHSTSILQRLESNRSYQSIDRQISHDIHNADALIEILEDWLKSINAAAYKQDKWSKEMKVVYEHYKEKGKKFAEAKRELANYKSEGMSHEEDKERTELILKVGERACRAAEERLLFLDMYQKAYPHSQIKGHIIQGKDQLNAAKNAVRQARHEMTKQFHHMNPAIFH